VLSAGLHPPLSQCHRDSRPSGSAVGAVPTPTHTDPCLTAVGVVYHNLTQHMQQQLSILPITAFRKTWLSLKSVVVVAVMTALITVKLQ